jgi:hypothetical protein
MMRSSIAIGCLPDAAGLMSWITPEAVGGTILDIAFGQGQPDRALNIVHPRLITWTTMINAAADQLVRQNITQDRLPCVTMGEWFTKLAEAAVEADAERLKRIVRPSYYLASAPNRITAARD